MSPVKNTMLGNIQFIKKTWIVLLSFIAASLGKAAIPTPSLVGLMSVQAAPTNLAGVCSVNSLCVDGQNNVYASGYFRGSLNYSGKSITNTNGQVTLFASRLDAYGNPVWLTNSSAALSPFATIPNPQGGFTTISYFHGPLTNVFTGSTMVSTSDWGALIMKLNSNGAVTASFMLEANGTNNTYMTCTNPAPPFKIISAQFDRAGNFMWAEISSGVCGSADML